MKAILMVCCLGLMCLFPRAVVVAQTTSNIRTVKDPKGRSSPAPRSLGTSATLALENRDQRSDGFYRLCAASGNVDKSPRRRIFRAPHLTMSS
jgi:hypothetical protein